MSTVITPFQGTDPFSTATFNNRISQINTGFSYISNPNLLDNWYFGTPVDQRDGYVVPPGSPLWLNGEDTGKVTDKYYPCKVASSGDWDAVTIDGVTYSVWKTFKVRGYTGAGYGIDRWSLDNNTDTLLVRPECVSFKTASYGAFIQPLDVSGFPNGCKFTYSALCKVNQGTLYLTFNDGTWKPSSDISESENLQLITYTFTLNRPSTNLAKVYFACNSQNVDIDIIAAKLELGDTQTLAHQDENGNWVLNEIPDYGEQLARCQRYFCRMYCKCPPKNSSATIESQNGGFISFPVTMRTNPTSSLISKEVSTISLGEITVNGFDVGGADNYSRAFVADFTADL